MSQQCETPERKTIELEILNRRFRLTIDPEDEAPLREAAAIVTEKLAASHHGSAEMRALTVAFNMAYEYVLLRQRSEALIREIHTHLTPLKTMTAGSESPNSGDFLHEHFPPLPKGSQKN